MRQLPFVGTLIGATLLACGLLGVDAARAAQEAQAGNVKQGVQRSVAGFARLLRTGAQHGPAAGQNPVFSKFLHRARRRTGQSCGATRDRCE